MKTKKLFGVASIGVSVVLLSQACGSEDSKKKAQQGPNYMGQGGDGEPSGGRDATGTAGTNGMAAAAGQASGEAGTSSVGEGGMPGAAGGAGGASTDPGDGCEPGFGECDGDPETVCEQNLNLVTSCGACKTSCSSAAATVACEAEACVVKSCNAGFGDCNDDAVDACETPINTATDCGACGRDCAALGSTCSTDKCNEIPMQQGQPIGSDGGANRTWAFSPLGLLQTTGSYNYAVRRYPLDGSATQIVWAPTNESVGQNNLLVIDDTVYWGEWGTGGDDFTAAVFSKKITDPAGTLPTLAWGPEWPVQFLRRQGNAFYWMSGDYQSGDPGAWIYTRPVGAGLNDHGTKIMSVDQQTHNGVVAFNVTSDAIYWVTTQVGAGVALELRTTPLAGGTPTVVPNVPGAQTADIAVLYGVIPSLQVVGKTLYFSRVAGGAFDGIYSFNKGDAAPKRLVQASSVTSFLLDDAFFYYAQQNVSGIWKAPITGGAGVLISDDNVARIVGQDDTFVYAITSGCCAGDIYKVIK